jgi:hypothetical protein
MTATATTIGRAKDLAGQRFGRYAVVAFNDKVRGISRWLCRCDCGTEKVVWKKVNVGVRAEIEAEIMGVLA